MRNAVNKTIAIIALAALCSWGLAATAWPAGMAQPKVEYSADQTVSGEGRTFQAKVYHARDKQRMEMSTGGSGQVFITRLDKKVSWVLMPEQKAYTELSLDQSRKNAPSDLRECTMNMTKAGTETVNGHSTTRYNMEATCPDSSRYAGSMWVTKDNIPVKIDATVQGGSGKGSRVLIELRNLKVTKQDPALFEVPDGYSKFAIPGFGGPAGPMGGTVAPQRKTPAERSASEVSGPDTGRSYTAQPRDTGPTSSSAPPRTGKKVTKGSPEAGRSYTATGRSYTAQPRDSGTSEEAGTVDKAIGAGQKLKRLFGW